MQARLLIIADQLVAHRFAQLLPHDCWSVHSVELGCDSLRAVIRLKPSAIIVDSRGGGRSLADYFRTIASIEAMEGVPLVALTRQSQPGTLDLLEAGAEGCWAEPLEDREIELRLMQMHRRLYPPRTSRILSSGGIELDLDRYAVRVDGRAVQLTAMQLKLLRYFLERPDAIVSRDELLDRVWRKGSVGDDAIRKCVAALRSALAANGSGARLARTGGGYLFRTNASAPVASRTDA